MALIEHYKVITVTHHNLNVGEIGHFFVHCNNSESTYGKLRDVSEEFKLSECLYLETCNRVCFILFADIDLSPSFLSHFFQKINPALSTDKLSSINRFISIYEGEAAINHVLELASSIDSLVVGEREIFRQMRKAYDVCNRERLIGDYLKLLINTVVASAKDIYNSTKIGEKSLSVVALAIKSMLALNSSPSQKVLIVGAGETNLLVGKFLKKYNFHKTSIYNRSLNNAEELSTILDAPSFHLNELKHVNGEFDVIIICTSANKVVIDEALYSEMLRGDNSKKLIIDLAVPRNISREIVEQFNVDYIDINSLKELSEENYIFRKKEIAKARPIIKTHLKNFKNGFQQRHLEKALATVPGQVKQIKEKAIEVIYQKRISELDDDAKNLLVEMMNYMEKKCISIPIKSAKKILQH